MRPLQTEKNSVKTSRTLGNRHAACIDATRTGYLLCWTADDATASATKAAAATTACLSGYRFSRPISVGVASRGMYTHTPTHTCTHS